MDASNRLAVILGQYSVPISQLTPKERLEVVLAGTQAVAGDIQYFAGGKPVSDWIRRSRNGGDSIRVTDGDRVYLPMGFNHHTRLFEVSFLGHDSILDDGWVVNLSEWVLMLSKNNEFLLWTSHYRVNRVHHQGPEKFGVWHAEIALASDFVLLSEAELLQLLGWHPLLAWEIIDELLTYVRGAVKRREEALSNMRGSERALDDILSHIEGA